MGAVVKSCRRLQRKNLKKYEDWNVKEWKMNNKKVSVCVYHEFGFKRGIIE